jgi:hypothetical protein
MRIVRADPTRAILQQAKNYLEMLEVQEKQLLVGDQKKPQHDEIHDALTAAISAVTKLIRVAGPSGRKRSHPD